MNFLNSGFFHPPPSSRNGISVPAGLHGLVATGEAPIELVTLRSEVGPGLMGPDLNNWRAF